jgi:hypothetical protein
MSQVACSYAALRFLPYRETGEFANVGVVVWTPSAKFFGHRCNLRLGKRIRGFFPDLDLDIYRQALRGSQSMLTALRGQFAGVGTSDDVLVQRFHELVRIREGLMTFGPAGALLADSPDQALEILYQRLVLRQFASQPEYHEVVMRRRLADSLRAWNLMEFYQQEVQVGDDHFHITAPFAHLVELRPAKILRPLDLDKKDSTLIYRHGDVWASALRRLREFNTMPDQVVVPVRLPAGGERMDAAQRVIRALTEVGATALPIDDQDAIRRAAMVA